MSGPDRHAVARAFRRAAGGYRAADFLHQEIRARLLERLDLVALQPATLVDLGAGPPAATADLATRYPAARVLALDLVPEMLGAAPQDWERACADAAQLPLADQSVDLVVAGMLLHWCADADRVLAEARRVLRFPGLLLLSTLGPDSLRELRAAWAEVDRHTHTLAFPDMHNLGDALVRAGFAEPVVDSHVLTVTYGAVDDLVRDLRGVGATDLSAGRRLTLTGPDRWAAMKAGLERRRRADGQLPLTMEVIYGHAWAGEPRKKGAADEIVVSLEQLRRRS